MALEHCFEVMTLYSNKPVITQFANCGTSRYAPWRRGRRCAPQIENNKYPSTCYVTSPQEVLGD